jgi:hypothetical protein
LAHHQRGKIETLGGPQIEIPLEDGVPFLWPTYIGEKKTTLGKTYCIKSVVLLGTSQYNNFRA